MSQDVNQEIEEVLIQLRSAIRIDDDDGLETAKSLLISLGNTHGAKSVSNHLNSLRPKESLPVQWELEEVIELLDPPKKKEEVVDDPSTRQLRSSELTPIYQDPRGLSVFASKIDGRWVVMQLDPRTGAMRRQEVPEDNVPQIKMSLQGSPYWIVDPNTL
jgi:hypothetical protein